MDTKAITSRNFRNPTLTGLVSESRVIVVATPENPETREREIHFKVPPDKSALPYKQTLFRYRVNEVLLGEIPSGTIIEVVEANTQMRQRESYNYDVYGKTMSIAWRRYVPQSQPAENTPHILFLRGNAGNKDSDLEFIAQGGLEGIQAREEVVRLIAQRFGNFSRT